MYNDKILSELNNLNYLCVIKNSNISTISKKNQFNDMVKFYAQINKDDVIQKISYKASGCTYFLVFCNYFCELVEGKTVKDALKINSEKLEKIVELDESRKHIVKIILDTFAMLIKKYRKGIENKTIEPAKVEEVKKPTNKDTKKISENQKISSNEKEEKIVKNDVENKKTKTNKKQSEINDTVDLDNSNVTKEKKNIDKSTKTSKKTNTKISDKKINETKKEVVKKEANANHNSVKQASNILALKSMVQSSRKNSVSQEPEKKENKADLSNLNMMINKISRSEEKTKEDENSKRLQSLNKNLASIRSNQEKKNSKQEEKIDKKSTKKDTKKEKKSKVKKEKTEEKKKGLFGWFKK